MPPSSPSKRTASTKRGMIPLTWHDEARLILGMGSPPLLLIVGEPGVGKSKFARQQALAATGAEPLILSGSPEVEESHIWGRWTLAGTETRFVDGKLPTALKTNRWLVVEEFSQIAPETRATFMPLRDQDSITNPMTNEVIPIPADSFRLIATSNSEAITCRKNTGVARVLYDGFIVLEATELTDVQVRNILQFQFPDLTAKQADRAIEIWQEYCSFSSKGTTGKSFLSLRSVEHFVRLQRAGLSEPRAVEIAFVNKFLTGDRDLFESAKLKASLSE